PSRSHLHPRRYHRPAGDPRRRRPVHGSDHPSCPRRPVRSGPGGDGGIGGSGRSGTSTAPDQTRLRRQEPAHVRRPTGDRAPRGHRRPSRGLDPPGRDLMKHLLSVEELSRGDLEDLLDLGDEFVDVLDRDIPKGPTLRGATVATMFFEPSTRPRLSFERAARALSADVLSFAPGSSSLTKGESLKDTALTLRA